MNKQFHMTIGGQPVSGSRPPLRVINPATEEVVAEAPNASFEQLGAAVIAAQEAFKKWKTTGVSERRELLLKFAAALEANAKTLSKLLTSEQGKPIWQAQAEVSRAAHWVRTTATLPFDEQMRIDNETHTVTVRHLPLGVVGGIVPWNFPVTLAIWKIAPAVLTGNTVVLKPSPFTPLTGLTIGQIANEVFPAGVVNVITGEDDLGPAMTAHDGIAKIAFTGSSATGKKVMETASRSLKRITLELGGNDAAIILDDVDPVDIAPKIFWACFANASQYCLATKRIYVHENIHDEFLAELVKYAESIKVGNGADEATQLGPIQNKMQFDKVMSFIEHCKSQGYTIAYEREVTEDTGYFVGPVIVDNPPEDSQIVVEEPFGPIVPVLSFSTDDEAIERANNSSYGLGGSVWGTDIVRARGIAEQIDSGLVWVNEIHKMEPEVPMGGHRESGIGVENGVEGLLSYCNVQSLAVSKQ